ncbi:PEGA domain-containing protein [Flavobacterium terrisoli]|uniref:PEGA domain-containing protein n=1 Tax=Flavobacterium terrisoli TaxID=3242195 RepID=UPI002542F0A8|nr:PEGA domain-containing protein [Flavobacterium buctense]
MKAKIITLSIISCLLLSSCATIVSGSKQTVTFTSNPSQANVSINGLNVGKTPFETKLKRKTKEHKIVIQLDGYKPFETTLKRKFNAWYVGNLAFGGLIGLIVDPLTGAIFKLTPDQVNAELAKGITMKDNGNDIYIGVALTIDPTWEKIGTLTQN